LVWSDNLLWERTRSTGAELAGTHKSHETEELALHRSSLHNLLICFSCCYTIVVNCF